MTFNHPRIFESNTSSSSSPRSDNQGMQGLSVTTQPSTGIVSTATNPSQVIFSLSPPQSLLTVGLFPQEVQAVMHDRSALMMQRWPYGAGVPTDTSAEVPSPSETINSPTTTTTATSVSPAVMNDLVEILSSAASARARALETTSDLTYPLSTTTSPAVASLHSTEKSLSKASNVMPSPSISPGLPVMVKPRLPASSNNPTATTLSRTLTSSPDATVIPTPATSQVSQQQENMIENEVTMVAAAQAKRPTKAEVPTETRTTGLQVQEIAGSSPHQTEAGLIDTVQHTVMQNMQRGPVTPIFIHPLRSPIPVRPRQHQQEGISGASPSSTSATPTRTVADTPCSKKRLAYPSNKVARPLQEHRAVTTRALKAGTMMASSSFSSLVPDSAFSFSSSSTTYQTSHQKKRATEQQQQQQQHSGPSLSSCYNKLLDIIPHHPSPVLIPFLCLTGGSLPSTKGLPPSQVVKDDSIKQEHPIHTPGRVDILCGRGRGCTHHLGNCTFRRLIDIYRPVFASLPRGDRPQLVRNLVQYIRWQGGRFLTRRDPNSGNDEPWYECGDEKARHKVSQALRDSKNRWKNAKKECTLW